MGWRIFLAGVGGQGTLTVTNLLAKIALDKGLDVVAGEIHGMAQRGGVVHTFVLLGGYLSPKIDRAEADFLLGFEPLETLRALKFVKPKQGIIISSTDPIYPPSFSQTDLDYPQVEQVQKHCTQVVDKSYFLSVLKEAEGLGVVQVANVMLLASFLALDKLPLGLDELRQGIKKYFKPKLVEINLKAVEVGKKLVCNS